MLVDTSKTAFENMLALLNTTNGTEYTEEDVSFGPPVVYSDVAHPDYNTKVVMTGIGDYTGTIDLFYKRLDLAREIMYRDYQGGAYPDVETFMAYVATRNDVIGTDIILEIDYIPNGPGDIPSHILPAVDSWLYMGEREIVFLGVPPVTP
jgi:hypothetical protein